MKQLIDLIQAFWYGEIPCLFRTLTGHVCPGCGMTRAVKALLSGNITGSFCFNPVPVYAVSACIFYLIARYAFHKRAGFVLFYIGAALAFINWIMRY